MKNYLSTNINFLRKQSGMTQEQFANFLDTDYSIIGKWENGTRSPVLEDILKLSKIFNLSLDSLIKNKLNCELCKTNDFKDKINDFMDEKSINNIKQLALKSDIPYTTLRDCYEKNDIGNSRISTMKKLAQYMDCTIDYLTCPKLENRTEIPNLENKEVLSQNLKYYMNINHIDRNKLCEDLNLKYTTLTDWINAKKYPRIDKIEMLANYFEIQKSDLIEEKTENTNSINNYIGSKIKEFRTEKKLTQDELAEYLNTTPQTISRYEKGERKIDNDMLFLLANYFHVPINSFFPTSINNSHTLDKKDMIFINLEEDDKELLLHLKKIIDNYSKNNNKD